jgi:diguanylate cyclase (GGDEF)-like protein
VPTIASPHFVLDLPTLFAVTVFVSVIGGLLLLFTWTQNRSTPALAMWGLGYLMGAAGAALLASVATAPTTAIDCVANALICGAYGLMWGGARSFEGRRVNVLLLAVGAAICVEGFQFAAFQSVPSRIALASAITAAYALLSACELWFARDRNLISRWPTLALVVGHAGFLLARIPFAATLATSAASGHAQGTAVLVIAFEALFVVFCLPFLRVAMAKERTEVAQKTAALTDALTGIANRRAFFDRGSALLDEAVADRRPAALLLFDLDRFKEINDTAGHQAGDRVLQAFCGLVEAAMRPGDLFGRLGGEEFACLLADTGITPAMQTAERLRSAFGRLRLSDLTIRPTVSVGIAMASDGNLQTLLAAADRALYRAKADGRNRVARAPLSIVGGDGSAARRPSERPATVIAPIAG